MRVVDMNENPLPNLTTRQSRLLSAIIRSYIHQPEPVSSKQLAETTDLGVSSATIRNELVILEQLGMIRAPHTSSGRVPTEDGYRYFVKHMVDDTQPLTAREQRTIQAEFRQAPQDIHQLLYTAASVLARQTNSAALVTEPRAQAVRFKHVELIATYGHMVLMVLVLEGGNVLQQMLTLQDVADQEQLSRITTKINSLCSGETANGIHYKATQVQDTLAHEVIELVGDVLLEAEVGQAQVIHWYGFGDLLSKFDEDASSAQQALRILDEKTIINNVLSEVLQEDDDDPIKVLVGGDGRFEHMSELSIVVGRYGTSQLSGAMSVLGPTRMRYGRAISTVRYVSTLISTMLQNVYGMDRN